MLAHQSFEQVSWHCRLRNIFSMANSMTSRPPNYRPSHSLELILGKAPSHSRHWFTHIFSHIFSCIFHHHSLWLMKSPVGCSERTSTDLALALSFPSQHFNPLLWSPIFSIQTSPQWNENPEDQPAEVKSQKFQAMRLLPLFKISNPRWGCWWLPTTYPILAHYIRICIYIYIHLQIYIYIYIHIIKVL